MCRMCSEIFFSYFIFYSSSSSSRVKKPTTPKERIKKKFQTKSHLRSWFVGWLLSRLESNLNKKKEGTQNEREHESRKKLNYIGENHAQL